MCRWILRFWKGRLKIQFWKRLVLGLPTPYAQWQRYIKGREGWWLFVPNGPRSLLEAISCACQTESEGNDGSAKGGHWERSWGEVEEKLERVNTDSQPVLWATPPIHIIFQLCLYRYWQITFQQKPSDSELEKKRNIPSSTKPAVIRAPSMIFPTFKHLGESGHTTLIVPWQLTYIPLLKPTPAKTVATQATKVSAATSSKLEKKDLGDNTATTTRAKKSVVAKLVSRGQAPPKPTAVVKVVQTKL